MDHQPTQQEIALRAYAMWEKEGRPHGRSLEHWLAAERELVQVSVSSPMPLSVDVGAKPAKRASPASRKAATPKAKPRGRAEKPVAKDLH